MEMLDFNAISRPTWAVKLKDDAQTVVHLSYPSVAMVEKLQSMGAELQEIAEKKDVNSIHGTFSVVAEVMSYNEDGLTFSAEDLRDVYHLTLLDVARFISGYMQFLQEANEAKN